MKTGSFFLRNVAARPIDRILTPFDHLLHSVTSGGIVLFAVTIVALVWANSPWGESYERLWQTELTFAIGSFALSKPILLWINDGLMAIFFFVVGLEIKREVLVGELSRVRQAALPIAAAAGGMVFPALVYFAINPQSPELRGWGVPMATDIAFSLGVLALLGKRIPTSAKIFLTAFAIVDDIGASLVIAVFYTDDISFISLAFGGGVFALMVGINLLGVRKPLPYALLGTLLWVAFLKSGVHPTIAGILGAMTIPARTRIDARDFLDSSKTFLEEFEKRGLAGESVLTNTQQCGALRSLEAAAGFAQTPLQRLEHGLHTWVGFAILPIFALANAGVSLGAGIGDALAHPVALGTIAGLIVGKQIGVTLFAWLGVRLGLADMPPGLTWRHIYGMSWLGAIGFTMSLFIAGLAFDDNALLATAKVGILAGSLIAGVGGWSILRGARSGDGAAAADS